MVKERKRGGKQSPERMVENMVELIAALSNIRNGGNGHREVLDPSVNVKEMSTEAISGLRRENELTSKYEEKLRNSDQKWQERLDTQKERTAQSAQAAEASRLDAKIQDIVGNQAIATQELKNTALTLAKTVSDTAETARKTVEVAAQQQSELIGQVRDSVTDVRTLVTNFIAAGGATKVATIEQTQTSRFASERLFQLITILIGIVAASATIAFTVKTISGK